MIYELKKKKNNINVQAPNIGNFNYFYFFYNFFNLLNLRFRTSVKIF
jgi:hypothetical protein